MSTVCVTAAAFSRRDLDMTAAITSEAAKEVRPIQLRANHIAEDIEVLVANLGTRAPVRCRPRLALAALKGRFNGLPTSLADELELEIDLQTPLLRSADYLEAVAAFKEKRTSRLAGT